MPTDKIEHGLIKEYEKLFSNIRNEKLKILEVGVFKGESLIWLQEYFPNATVYGMDVYVPESKFKIFTCNQNDSNGMLKMVEETGDFDIIIDDGSHLEKETRNTFNVLWPHTKTYVIEDWIAHYFSNPNNVYRGMLNVITEIMNNKTDLGIKQMDILLRDPLCSLAYFKR